VLREDARHGVDLGVADGAPLDREIRRHLQADVEAGVARQERELEHRGEEVGVALGDEALGPISERAGEERLPPPRPAPPEVRAHRLARDVVRVEPRGAARHDGEAAQPRERRGRVALRQDLGERFLV
jgi:hypothetical protein